MFGNFGALPKPPCTSSKRLTSMAVDDALEELGARRIGRLAVRVAAPDLGDRLRELVRLLVDLAAALAVRLGEGREDLGKARHPVAIRGRKVGAREERLLLRREEDGERPAAAAPHELHDELVDLIEVGALLAIDLDAHEVLVHERRDRLVLEALALHDVAPVAGRVADREEDRLVTALGLARAPRRPTGTSRPGCVRAAAGTATPPSRGGSASGPSVRG